MWGVEPMEPGLRPPHPAPKIWVDHFVISHEKEKAFIVEESGPTGIGDFREFGNCGLNEMD